MCGRVILVEGIWFDIVRPIPELFPVVVGNLTIKIKGNECLEIIPYRTLLIVPAMRVKVILCADLTLVLKVF